MTTNVLGFLLADPAPVPWELIGGGSAALAVLVSIWMNQKHVAAVVDLFTKAVVDANAKNKENVETFTKATTTLVAEAREAHRKCEETLHALLREQIPRRHRATDEEEP